MLFKVISRIYSFLYLSSKYREEKKNPLQSSIKVLSKKFKLEKKNFRTSLIFYIQFFFLKLIRFEYKNVAKGLFLNFWSVLMSKVDIIIFAAGKNH